MFGNVSLPQKVETSFGDKAARAKFKNPETNQLTDKTTAFNGFENLKSQAFTKVYDHELQHQQAGGSQAGSINIDYNSNGFAIGGHVDIQVPKSVNPQAPEVSKKEAEIAYNAAMAPSDPSSADLSIASMASAIMNKALQLTGKNDETGDINFKKKDNAVKGKKFNMIG